MKISEKITEIRQKPEHVRMRYVWGSVLVCMVVIFSIWIFSISNMFQAQKNSRNDNDSSTTDIAKKLQNLKNEAPSLKNYTSQPLGEGIDSAKEVNSDFKYSAPANNSNNSQTSAYSDLPTRPAQ